jgi:hypothetical protein
LRIANYWTSCRTETNPLQTDLSPFLKFGLKKIWLAVVIILMFISWTVKHTVLTGMGGITEPGANLGIGRLGSCLGR